MGRGRGDGQPGLIERVRWGNVARLAALLAGGVLIAVGPHSCGARPPTAVELPAPRASVPPATAPTRPTGPSGSTGGVPLGRTEPDPIATRPRTPPRQPRHPKHRRRRLRRRLPAASPARLRSSGARPRTRPARRAPRHTRPRSSASPEFL